MKRIAYFDMLKVISIIGVVFIHVLGELFYVYDIYSLNYQLVSFLDSLLRFSVPIFYMISGYLFLRDDKDITIKQILTKYVFQLLILFLIWNTAYGLSNAIINNGEQVSFSVIFNAIKESILGHRLYQLGFLDTTIGFYLCVPILRLITKKENKRIIEYFIILTLIYSGIISFLKPLFGIEITYPILFSGYIPYFILGYYLTTFDLKKEFKNKLYIAGGISVIITFLLTIYFTNVNNTPYDLLLDYLTIFNIIYSVSIFVFIKDHYQNIKETKLLKFLSNTYFGIFIIHGFALGLAYKLNLFNLDIPLILKILVIGLFVYTVSLLTSYIMSKIPVVKKLIRAK